MGYIDMYKMAKHKNVFVHEFFSYFKDLFSIYDVKPDTYKTFDLTSSYNHGNLDFGIDSKDNMVQQITRQIGKEITSRQDLIQQLASVKDNEIVQTILDVIIDDGFNSMSDNEFMSVEYKPDIKRSQYSKLDAHIQETIDSFVSKFDLCELFADITPDFLFWGEYFLRTKVVKGQGIVSIEDDVNIDECLAIYKSGEANSFVRYNKKSGTYEYIHKDELAHFTLSGGVGNGKVRVTVEREKDVINLPEYIRQGRSIIYPLLNSLKKLNVLEMSSLAIDLKRILAPILVSVDIPQNTDVQHVSDIIDRYEGYLNDIHKSANQSDSFNMSDILSMANRVKVLPKYSDNKGSIETLNIDKDTTDLTEKINNIRKSISLTAGIPSYYIALGDQMLEKKDLLKAYSRYSRKLVGIQKALAKGIRGLVHKHLRYSNLYVNPANIQVKFKSITNVDLLDDVEYMLGVMTTVKDIFAILNEVASSDQTGLQINDDQMLKFFNTYTSVFPHMNGLLEKFDGTQKAFNMGGGMPPANSPDMGSGGMGAGIGNSDFDATGAMGGTGTMGATGGDNNPVVGGASSKPLAPTNSPNSHKAGASSGDVSIGDVF